eukprot:364635-Chlamydomonas_euryale.AAC.10
MCQTREITACTNRRKSRHAPDAGNQDTRQTWEITACSKLGKLRHAPGSGNHGMFQTRKLRVKSPTVRWGWLVHSETSSGGLPRRVKLSTRHFGGPICLQLQTCFDHCIMSLYTKPGKCLFCEREGQLSTQGMYSLMHSLWHTWMHPRMHARTHLSLYRLKGAAVVMPLLTPRPRPPARTTWMTCARHGFAAPAGSAWGSAPLDGTPLRNHACAPQTRP